MKGAHQHDNVDDTTRLFCHYCLYKLWSRLKKGVASKHFSKPPRRSKKWKISIFMKNSASDRKCPVTSQQCLCSSATSAIPQSPSAAPPPCSTQSLTLARILPAGFSSLPLQPVSPTDKWQRVTCTRRFTRQVTHLDMTGWLHVGAGVVDVAGIDIIAAAALQLEKLLLFLFLFMLWWS